MTKRPPTKRPAAKRRRVRKPKVIKAEPMDPVRFAALIT